MILAPALMCLASEASVAPSGLSTVPLLMSFMSATATPVHRRRVAAEAYMWVWVWVWV